VPFLEKENCHHLAECNRRECTLFARLQSLFSIRQTFSFSYVHSPPPPVTLLSINFPGDGRNLATTSWAQLCLSGVGDSTLSIAVSCLVTFDVLGPTSISINPRLHAIETHATIPHTPT